MKDYLPLFNTNAEYEIRIYENIPEGGAPQEGELVLTQKGSEKYCTL